MLQDTPDILRGVSGDKRDDPFGQAFLHRPGQGRDLLGSRCFPQGELDFRQFNPMPSDFHLMIDSSEILQTAVLILHHQIACPVPDVVACSGQGDELFLGLLGVIPIPLRHLGAGETQLPAVSRGDRMERRVDDAGLLAAERAADRRDPRLADIRRGGGIPAIMSNRDGRFRRTIEILDQRMGCGLLPDLGMPTEQRFSAKQARPQRGKQSRLQHAEFLHHPDDRRNREPHGNGMVADELGGRHDCMVRHGIEAGASLPADEHVVHAQVEAHLKHLREAVFFVHRISVGDIPDIGREVALSNRHAFRVAGTARRE